MADTHVQPPPPAAGRTALVIIAVIATGAALVWLRRHPDPAGAGALPDVDDRLLRPRAAPAAALSGACGAAARDPDFADPVRRRRIDRRRQRAGIRERALRLCAEAERPHRPDRFGRWASPCRRRSASWSSSSTPPPTSDRSRSAVSNFAAAAFLVMIYLGFLLASRTGFEKKLARALRQPGRTAPRSHRLPAHPQRRRGLPVGPDGVVRDHRARLLGGDGGGRAEQRGVLGLRDLHHRLHPDHRRHDRCRSRLPSSPWCSSTTGGAR